MVEGKQKIVLLGVCPIPVAETVDAGEGGMELVRKFAHLHCVHLFIIRFNIHTPFCTTQWSIKFNVEAIIRWLSKVINVYAFDKITDFASCQTADSTNINIRIAKDLNSPHVPCKNHNLNLEGQEMDRHD